MRYIAYGLQLSLNLLPLNSVNLNSGNHAFTTYDLILHRLAEEGIAYQFVLSNQLARYTPVALIVTIQDFLMQVDLFIIIHLTNRLPDLSHVEILLFLQSRNQ